MFDVQWMDVMYVIVMVDITVCNDVTTRQNNFITMAGVSNRGDFLIKGKRDMEIKYVH